MKLSRSKYKVLLASTVVVIFFLVSCERSGEKNKDGITFTCPMHPEIRKSEPGNCPICKMKLVPEETMADTLAVEHLLDPTNSYVVSDLEAVKPKRSFQNHSVIVHGTITYDERLSNSIAARVGGRIEKLYVKYRFQSITVGQRLFDLYSPELINEQQNFIFLMKNEKSNTGIVESARTRLKLLGMTDGQIKQVEGSSKAIDPVPFYSPYSGHLHIPATDGTGDDMNSMPAGNRLKNENTSVLFKEGMYVTKGQMIFQINSTAKVWAILNLGLKESSAANVGDPVRILVQNDTIQGQINFIEPALKNGQSFVNARVYLANKNDYLKIGENITAVLQSNSDKAMFLPSTAVVSLGLRNIVFVKDGERYKAKQIQTGERSGAMIEVISGLDSSTQVAKNAAFLIDSESFVSPHD